MVGSIDHARVEMSISPRGTVKPATRAKRATMRVDVAQQGKFLPQLRDKLLTSHAVQVQHEQLAV
eukprot:COSAG02_NODE_2066_length_9960_cov_3.087009_8_plen_64_part_01